MDQPVTVDHGAGDGHVQGIDCQLGTGMSSHRPDDLPMTQDIGTAENRTIEAIRNQAPRVKRWSGVTLVAVGVWFLLLAAFTGFFAELFPV